MRPVELHLAAQQARDDRPAERGRAELAASSAGNWMCAIITASAPAAMPCAERRQLDRLEPLARLIDDRQPEVRVHVGVAVTGKMLQRREHAAGAQAADVRGRQPADRVRLLAERARVDDGIARVVVDVGDRREIDVHADRARLDRRDARASNASCSSPAAPTAICRGNTVAPAMRKPSARLEVAGVEQRQRRSVLQPVQQRRGRERLAENHRSVVVAEQHVRDRLGAAEHVDAAEPQLAAPSARAPRTRRCRWRGTS